MARFHNREGFCADDEVCFDIQTDIPQITIASCSREDAFDEWHRSKDGRVIPMVDGEMFQPVVSMYASVSEADKSLSLPMGSIKITTSGSGKGGARKEKAQVKKCRDCSEIETNLLAPETDSLRIEGMIMGGASAAATGVLWLTLLTG